MMAEPAEPRLIDEQLKKVKEEMKREESIIKSEDTSPDKEYVSYFTLVLFIRQYSGRLALSSLPASRSQ